jgi:hypothetical protein
MPAIPTTRCTAKTRSSKCDMTHDIQRIETTIMVEFGVFRYFERPTYDIRVY